MKISSGALFYSRFQIIIIVTFAVNVPLQYLPTIFISLPGLFQKITEQIRRWYGANRGMVPYQYEKIRLFDTFKKRTTPVIAIRRRGLDIVTCLLFYH
jgi:hypothetical protein